MTVPHLDRREYDARSAPPDSWYGQRTFEELQALHDRLASSRRSGLRDDPFYIKTPAGHRRVETARVNRAYL